MGGFKMVGCSDGGIIGCVAEVSTGTGFVLEDCHDTIVSGNRAYVGLRGKNTALVGRNKPCPCGSGVKFKKCHLGKNMATGIKSTDSSATFKDTVIVSSDIGIDLTNDRSSFEQTKIFAGSSEETAQLIAKLGLPKDTPPEYLKEAMQEVSTTRNPSSLEKSKLKVWLFNNGFDPAAWVGIALSIVGMVFK